MKNTTSVKVFPSTWKGAFLSLQIENENGEGKAVLYYGNDKSIILSERIGITPKKRYLINAYGDKIGWISSHGSMITDGKVIQKIDYSPELIALLSN